MIFRGKVKKGFQKGKGLGFPTANIAVRKRVDEGIYISYTRIKKIKYFSLTFIGETAETYILDFNANLYNQWISVELIKKIRGNIKFSSEEQLIERMKKDELVARKFFNVLI